eukprot:m.82151 g.82151  ORF g.82151 m.82151 type:complete len:95 (-) comp25493_c0_seq1:15-299(-)
MMEVNTEHGRGRLGVAVPMPTDLVCFSLHCASSPTTFSFFVSCVCSSLAIKIMVHRYSSSLLFLLVVENDQGKTNIANSKQKATTNTTTHQTQH